MTHNQSDSWSQDLRGTRVGEYRLVDFLGEGEIGYVYRAEHKDFPGAQRAIKLIFDHLNEGWEVELRKVMGLELVPNVVHFHEMGTDRINHDGKTRLCQYTVWDYIPPGENLQKHLERVGKVRTSFLVSVIERILHVLHACHQKGVARHGDLHPGNILIGDETASTLDDSLQPRAAIFVSDFGYGATGAAKIPKDDYKGLANIINEVILRIEYSSTTSTDRQILQAIRQELGKLLRESPGAERRKPLELLSALSEIKQCAKGYDATESTHASSPGLQTTIPNESLTVGQFQVSEMIGERWHWWKRLFVPTVPARSKILALDIPTVVTGPRGCGKTMLFRRLSERLVVECGEVTTLPMNGQFVAFYVNANDFADVCTRFPEQPTVNDETRLVCYANLCVLADLLAVQSARMGRMRERPTEAFLKRVQAWLVSEANASLLEGEDRLEQYRTILEQIKWTFLRGQEATFPGFEELSQHRWLQHFVREIRKCCSWIASRAVLLFIDDYSTPRVSPSMQRVLNRLFLQRSPDFLAKIATEAFSTFVSEDSSGKHLQDGDDYQLVDMGEEALFLPDTERQVFLNEVLSRRLSIDRRVPSENSTLEEVLGLMPLSKTEFARRLRGVPHTETDAKDSPVDGSSQRRGPSRARVTYAGANVFSDLWSGDTRTLIQLITDVVDDAAVGVQPGTTAMQLTLPVEPAIQDRVFRNRGGLWLDSQTRNEPTDRQRMSKELSRFQQLHPDYQLSGAYGDHLKAVVEAFVAAARNHLLGPTYVISEGKTPREVPRMAFRIEIIDEFRLGGLAQEIYRDLVRYGLFMRDSRGKSIRGAFVPRLYLRRLLLPFCSLALSKRDSVQLNCAAFMQLLLEPDRFKTKFAPKRSEAGARNLQIPIPFAAPEKIDAAYDDISTAHEAEEEILES